MRAPRIAIIAGEASGDLHGALLTEHLRDLCPGAELWGAGGKRMKQAGVELMWESSSTGAIGIAEALKLAPGLLAQFFRLRRILLERRPDVLTLIDFGAFNKRVAGFARRNGIYTVYYMPPGAWRRRPRSSQAYLADKFITPFEWSHRILKDAGADVALVGHPLLDVVRPTMTADKFYAKFELKDARPVVGILPGSRKQEIKHIFPAMLGAVELINAGRPGIDYVVAAAGEVQARTIKRMVENAAIGRSGANIRIAEALTYDVLANSHLVITASGTATLEAAILGTPMIIAYRGSSMSHMEYLLRGSGVLEEHIGLPNIIAEKRICPELLSKEASPKNISNLALEMLSTPSKMAEMKKELAAVRSALGMAGGSRMAAVSIIESISQRSPE